MRLGALSTPPNSRPIDGEASLAVERSEGTRRVMVTKTQRGVSLLVTDSSNSFLVSDASSVVSFFHPLTIALSTANAGEGGDASSGDASASQAGGSAYSGAGGNSRGGSVVVRWARNTHV